MQFVDTCTLEIEAGDGGNGIIAWRKEAHYPQGGPWGGDGGNGGNVIIIGDKNVSSLFHLRYLKKVKAQDGQNGQTKLMFGKHGNDYIIKVPIGTQISDFDNNQLIVDIIYDNQTFILAHGGLGGRGNAYFKSSTNRAPTLYENGDLGEKLKVILKLKYIADIGLVGLPNAGKSSLIRCLSNAKPKIANYPFTTLEPVLGMFNYRQSSLIIADIPGLIEGASNNKGLGFNFLQHIERCHILIHVISLDQNDHADIVQAYKTIINELQNYNISLLNKKWLIVANKNDCPQASQQLKKLKKIVNDKIIDISALEKNNIDLLKKEIISLNKQIIQNNFKSDIDVVTVEQKKQYSKEFKFYLNEDNKWVIESKYLSYWLHKIPQTTKDNIYRFNCKLNGCNVDKILKENGADSKDTILIDGMEFEID